jgi:toxin ParE1/3/4
MNQAWQIRLSDQAEQDLISISRWTAQNFGSQQAERYVESVLLAIDELKNDPWPFEAKPRNDMGQGIHLLHMARHGRKGRHFVVYRVTDSQILEVLRFLHDGMDFARHLPSSATDH